MKRLLIAATAALAIFTMTTPVQAASLKPTVLSVDNKKPAAAGGTPITITGTNLGTVTSVAVDNSLATISAKTAKTLTFLAPQHALGWAAVTVTNPAGYVIFNINYSPQRRPLVPSPVLPDSIKLGTTYTVVGQDPTWKITITTDTPMVCQTVNNTIKGIKRGSCSVNMDINPDPANGSNPSWRGKLVIDSLLIK